MTNSTTTSTRPSSAVVVTRGRAARAVARLVRLYQWATAGRTSACRFYPSCSNYALEALETHGARRGASLALRRVLRCRPLGPHGIDLVPEPSEARSPSR